MAHFSFEDLDVWKKAVDFADMVIDVVDTLNTDRKHFRLIEQLESAVTSISMNIAEGKGRLSKKELVQFLSYARGSLFEVITLAEVFKRREWIREEQYTSLRDQGDEVGKMISGLMKSVRKPMVNG